MNLMKSMAAVWISALGLGSVAGAAETVTVEQTHLCCKSCVNGAEKAIKSAGATAQSDAKAGKITISAPDAATAQKAVDALAAAGYAGKVTGAQMKDATGLPTGHVKSATVSGFHNCCKKCSTAINEVVKKVDGAKGEVELKAVQFTVTGDFDAKQLVEAFKTAGFSVKIDGK